MHRPTYRSRHIVVRCKGLRRKMPALHWILSACKLQVYNLHMRQAQLSTRQIFTRHQKHLNNYSLMRDFPMHINIYTYMVMYVFSEWVIDRIQTIQAYRFDRGTVETVCHTYAYRPPLQSTSTEQSRLMFTLTCSSPRWSAGRMGHILYSQDFCPRNRPSLPFFCVSSFSSFPSLYFLPFPPSSAAKKWPP